MCDDASRADMALSRRTFARGAAGIGFGAALGNPAWAGDGALAEAMVEIPVGAGHADGFFVAPKAGGHPGVVMWPDIAGLRETFKAMARRLAGAGYAVLAVNQYWRSARAPLFDGLIATFTPEGRAKTGQAMAALTPAALAGDARAYARWLAAQPAVDARRGLGTVGYCYGGGLAMRAAEAERRITAAASLHGAGLVTPAPDSPHRALGQSDARFLFAIARNDDARAPGDKDALRAAAMAAHRPAEISVFPADHGWCVPDAPSFDRAAADRAFARTVALFAGL